MKQHPFSPAALVTGLLLLLLAIAFLADSAGAWHLGVQTAVPLVLGCLATAAVTSVATRVIRGRAGGRRKPGSGP
jgi:hypothetical protein